MKLDNNTVALVAIVIICGLAAFTLGAKAETVLIGGIGVIGGYIGGKAVKKDGEQ